MLDLLIVVGIVAGAIAIVWWLGSEPGPSRDGTEPKRGGWRR